MPKHKVFNDSDSDADDVEDDDSIDDSPPALAEKDSTSGSDSEAEPEAVTFSDSRKNVLDRVRTAIRQIERDRHQLRAKRQKKDAIYNEQKRLKLEKLTKLPDDVLEAVSSVEPVARKQKKSTSDTANTETSDTRLDIQPNIEVEHAVATEDYIPLNSTGGVKAVSVRHLSKTTSTSDNALKFHRQRSNNSRILRESGSSVVARSMKRRIMKTS